MPLFAPDFRWLLGVKPETFEAMLAALRERETAKKKRGRPPDLGLEEQLLLTLPFWREYRTLYHLAMEWQVGFEHSLPHDQAGGRRADQERQVRSARAS